MAHGDTKKPLLAGKGEKGEAADRADENELRIFESVSLLQPHHTLLHRHDARNRPSTGKLAM